MKSATLHKKTAAFYENRKLSFSVSLHVEVSYIILDDYLSEADIWCCVRLSINMDVTLLSSDARVSPSAFSAGVALGWRDARIAPSYT